MASLKPISLMSSKYLRKILLNPAKTTILDFKHYCAEVTPKRPIEPAKVRLGFIPDNWFEFFYNKTGVTGPYMFGVGLLNYLFSKEIYVCEHEFYSGLSLAIMCVVFVKKFGPKIAAYCDKEIDKFEANWRKLHEAELKALQDMIAREELEQWRAEGNLLLIQAKKENIDLQLEAAYREAITEIYAEVMHRLEYQVACYHVEQRLKYKNMISWLLKEITKQMPENMDKKLLEKYKGDISAMALRIK